MGLFLMLPEEYHGIHRGLSFATKYRSSKMRVFLFVMKTVFPMFVRISTQFAETQMPDKGCQGHWEFRLATGNAGTGMYQRGTIEHGCEFVPVARQKATHTEIPCAPCRHYVASVPGGQRRYSAKATGKTVYNQEKHAL